jgi:putative phage-type endonuclease
MSPIKIDFAQGTPEWLAWRMGGIGASDAPVIEGTSPYQTIRQLALEKMGRSVATESDPSKEFIFAKGHRTEALIRKQFQELINDEIQPVCFQHSEIEYLRASLDGFSQSHGVLEAKLVGKEVLSKALNDGEIPAHHYTQMQHQFAVSGADVGQWFGHDGASNGALIEVRANPEAIKRLLGLEHTFWANVKAGIVPPLSDLDYLFPDDLNFLVALRDAKELAENAKAQFETLRAQAAEFYGHSKVSGAGVKLIKTTREGSLDLLAIPEIAEVVELARKALSPSYIETFRKKGSESWTVRIDAPKKSKEKS